MVDATDSTPQPTDRDTRGRFAAGNRASRGNAVWRRQAELRRSIRDSVGQEDLDRVLTAMVKAASGGDVAAAGLLWSHVLGRPREAEPVYEPLALPALDTVAGVRAAHEMVVAAAAGGFVPLDVANQIADLIDRVAEAGALADLERRIEQVEAAHAPR